MTTNGDPSTVSSGPTAELRWTHWPPRDEPLLILLLLALIGAAGVLVGYATSSGWIGLLAASVVFLSLWKTWIPISYEIGARGVAESLFDRTQWIAWRDIARLEIFPGGFLLQAVPEASPLAGLRGTFVPFGNQRDQVLALVRQYGPRVGV